MSHALRYQITPQLVGVEMPDIRAIGRWALTGLMINSIIGSGIFGVPAELMRLVGTLSPWVFVLAGLVIAVIVACFAEVASQFSEGGGPYLYVRTAFGQFAGLQIAWFTALAPVAAAAAQANLFVNYLAGFSSSLGVGLARALVMTALIGIPLAANVLGARVGKSLSSLLVIAKLLPVAVLIVVGLSHSGSSASVPSVQAGTTYGAGAWFGAILLGVFSFGGFEDPLAATGDVNQPRNSIAFALAMSLIACVVVYTLVQFVVVGALGNSASERPLAAAASVWLGPGGAAMVAATAMLSTAGSISAIVLAAPRILAALGRNGDAPRVFARPGGATGAPVVASVAAALTILTLAITGTFPLALAITAGSMMIMIIGVCASLPRLRMLRPSADAVRIPFGRSLAAAGIGLSILLLIQLHAQEAALIGVTASFAALNWVLVRRAGS